MEEIIRFINNNQINYYSKFHGLFPSSCWNDVRLLLFYFILLCEFSISFLQLEVSERS